MSGVPPYPRWVAPSMVRPASANGNADSGAIVCTPAPGTSKRIVSVVVAALASTMAWRSVPGPLSPVLLTTNVASSMRGSSPSARANDVVLPKVWGRRT